MDGELVLLASGYGTIEGPTLDGDGNLYFSDVPGGGVYRLSPDGAVTQVIPKRRGVGGICLHADGGLVVSGRNIAHVRDGVTRAIVDRGELPVIDGIAAGGFNDIHADARGRVYAGATRRADNDERVAAELLLIRGPGDFTALYDDVIGSNGIAVTPDGTTIFHSETGRRAVRVSRFVEDDAVEMTARWSTEEMGGTPDGLALDEEGNVWVAFYRGGCIACFTPEGRPLARIDLPATLVTSLCFGGPDGRFLYIVTEDNADLPELRGTIFGLPLDVRGAPVGVARV